MNSEDLEYNTEEDQFRNHLYPSAWGLVEEDLDLENPWDRPLKDTILRNPRYELLAMAERLSYEGGK